MLIGKQLGKQVSASTTGEQARQIFALLAASLSSASQTLDAHNAPGAIGTGIASASLFGGLFTSIDELFTGASDGGSVQAAQDYLNSTASLLSTYLADMPDTGPLSEHQLEELRVAVSTTSVCVYQIDSLFSTGWAQELSDSIVETVNAIPAFVASTVAGAVGIVGRGLGSFIGGTWWIWCLAVVGLVLYVRHKRRS
jgi:hypothetical protein